MYLLSIYNECCVLLFSFNLCHCIYTKSGLISAGIEGWDGLWFGWFFSVCSVSYHHCVLN